jgi:phage terminase large subunit
VEPTRKSAPIEGLLRGPILPTGAKVVRANWRDNPWWNEELEAERLDFLQRNPTNTRISGTASTSASSPAPTSPPSSPRRRPKGRIGFVAADPLLTRHVFVDIGGTGARADAFVMWVVQFVGREIRVLDYYEAVGQPVGTHLDWLRRREYTPGRAQFWLPHDGSTQDKVYDASYEKALAGGGLPRRGRA